MIKVFLANIKYLIPSLLLYGIKRIKYITRKPESGIFSWCYTFVHTKKKVLILFQADQVQFQVYCQIFEQMCVCLRIQNIK